ncbi:enoyl-CoA hydratase/isomerase family protein [bacterium SCSIO 12827]|nr:enoyl-CoA hydratase/isomerase family protein [bacterium SCSIO 12827]
MTTPADDQGAVRLTRNGAVAHLIFDRPQARNAMTWTMYEGLADACDEIMDDPSVRVAVFRGAGGKAFVAGTDIAQFGAFSSGDDGLAYEDKVETYISRVERLPMPTLCVVEGWAVGGGMAIANACDFRIATTGSRFGVPIARTLGNCLSAQNLRALTETLGLPMVKRMLMLAEMPEAEELLGHGYLLAVAEADGIDALQAELVEKLLGHAPVTMRVTKEALRRLGTDLTPDDRDLIHAAYGSRDFKHGVESFVAKQKPAWKGV